MNKLTPAALKWLRRADLGPVWPTFGPYRQLVDAELLVGPQDHATITAAGRRRLNTTKES
jgi:hypothetical protein